MGGVGGSGDACGESVEEMGGVKSKNSRHRNRQPVERDKPFRRVAEGPTAIPPPRLRPSSRWLRSLDGFKDYPRRHPWGRRKKRVSLVAWVLISVAHMLFVSTIFKDIYCHDYADQRLLFLGIPSTMNVISSISFSVVVLTGIIQWHCKNYYMLSSSMALLIFFLGLTVIGFGSLYHHLNPNHASLVCNTLAVFIAFASAVAIFIIADGSGKKYCLWAAGLYLLVVVQRFAYEPIYRWTLQNVSGHTLAYLCATMVAVLLALTIAGTRLTIVQEPESHRILKYHLVPQIMLSLTSYVAFFSAEGFATMIEVIIFLWEFGARLVTQSETENRARQMVPQHVGVWGMDVYKSKAHDFLESKLPDDSALGLWGISGVGKTRLLTLMIECYVNGDTLFRHILPIENGSVTDIQLCLAVVLKLDWETMSSFEEHHRAKIISDYLKHDSFLVLLDDVQDKQLDLAACGLPMPLGGKRKLIMTSSSQAGCSIMGCTMGNIVEMKCLGAEDAWNLFKYKAGVEITEANVEVYKIAKQMVAACEGLPRAICAIGLAMAGATLCGTNPDDWWYGYKRFKAKNLPPERMEEFLAVQG